MNHYYLQIDSLGFVTGWLATVDALDDATVAADGGRVLKVDDLDAVQAIGALPRRWTGTVVTGVTDIGNYTNISVAPRADVYWTGSVWKTSIFNQVAEVTTGRDLGAAGPNDLALTHVHLDDRYSAGVAASDLELYVPSTTTTISYDATLAWPWHFPATTSAFNGSVFEVQLRLAATSQILCEFTVPVTTDNRVIIPLENYSA